MMLVTKDVVFGTSAKSTRELASNMDIMVWNVRMVVWKLMP